MNASRLVLLVLLAALTAPVSLSVLVLRHRRLHQRGTRRVAGDDADASKPPPVDTLPQHLPAKIGSFLNTADQGSMAQANKAFNKEMKSALDKKKAPYEAFQDSLQGMEIKWDMTKGSKCTAEDKRKQAEEISIPCLMSISELRLRNTGTQPILDFRILHNLKDLDLNDNEIASLAGVTFPEGLTWLGLHGNQIASLDGVTFPEGLKMLYLHNNEIASLAGVTFPEGLQTLYLHNNQIASLAGVTFPEGLQTLTLDDNEIASLDGATFPEGLEWLFLNRNPIAAQREAVRAAVPEGCSAYY